MSLTIIRAGGGGGGPVKRYQWINPTVGWEDVLTLNTIGRVYLAPIDVDWDMTIDRLIVLMNGTSAGNLRLGIYEEGGVDTPTGGALMAETASLAAPGTHRYLLATIANTALTQGQHYLAIQSDTTTCSIWTQRDDASSIGKWFANSIGYGAFDNPCPAVNTLTNIPMMGVRIVSIP